MRRPGCQDLQIGDSWFKSNRGLNQTVPFSHLNQTVPFSHVSQMAQIMTTPRRGTKRVPMESVQA